MGRRPRPNSPERNCAISGGGSTAFIPNTWNRTARVLGFIVYNGALKINNSLLSVVLRD
jgi:hypothetical protein